MELHLHLSVAFRALDRKWGAPVDLDTPGEGVSCLPAVIEQPKTTFSSEDFLRTIKRSQLRKNPYTQEENIQRKKIKRCDSFSNISISRFPSRSDLGSSSSTMDLSFDCSVDLEVEQKDCESGIGGSSETLDSVGKKKIGRRILKQLKKSAASFVDKRNWKKIRL